MADISDAELIALAEKHGISVPQTQSAGPSDSELIELARKNGIGSDAKPLPMISLKNPKDVNWKDAFLDELSSPFSGMRAGQEVPQSANAGTKAMGLIASGAMPTAARTAGLLDKAAQGYKTLKENAVPLYVARGIYHDIKGLLPGGH